MCVSWQKIVFAVAQTDHHPRCQCQCCWTHSACVSMCTGVELSVCEAWSRGSRRRSRERHHGDAPLSCCTRQMEARLSTRARHELSRLLTEQLDDVRHDFSNADAQFQSRPQHQTCNWVTFCDPMTRESSDPETQLTRCMALFYNELQMSTTYLRRSILEAKNF